MSGEAALAGELLAAVLTRPARHLLRLGGGGPLLLPVAAEVALVHPRTDPEGVGHLQTT